MTRLIALVVALGAAVPAAAQQPAAAVAQPVLGTRSVPVLQHDGLRFRDLNRNGALDPYEDWRLPAGARARDLVARMTLEEKAGTMMHGTARSSGPGGAVGAGSGYDLAAMDSLIRTVGVTSLITRLSGAPSMLAEQDDSLQALAERGRLGIPLTISTDPRNHFQYVPGASVQPGQFSQWPEPLGLAAVGDTALVRRFGDVARREYRAVGIQEALSPQADLATEPRWPRINGTFGEDAALAGRMVRAYVEGFQHGADGVDSAGVAAVVKHWVGYGAEENGFDGHNYYGRFADFPGGDLAYHVQPFLGALEVRVAGVMPTYVVLRGATVDGRPVEPVGAGFNRQLLTGLLRDRYHFQGVVLTDWAVTNDCNERCRDGVPAGERPSFAYVGMPWGVESLAPVDRFVKAVQAGVDQFGGTEDASRLVGAVRAGKLTEARLDESVLRILEQKFRLGLFENPYVDPAAAETTVGSADFRAQALDAQRRALVLLKNGGAAGAAGPAQAASGPGRLLPLGPEVKRVYLHGVDPEVAARYGWTVVPDPAQAQVAIIRIAAPYQTLHPGYVFGSRQHEGSLAYADDDPDLREVRRAAAAVPTIVTVYLDRPAILTPVRDAATALLGNFGVSDAALLDVLTGRARPEGKLPFELPSSMKAVEAQRPDLPHDSADPLYPFGFGLRY